MTQTARPVPDGTLSYEAFLDWKGENQHVEWEQGRVVPMAPVSGEHSEVGGFLLTLFHAYNNTHHLGVIRYEPFQMKTGPDLPGRAPDILFVASENLARMHDTYLEGPADLVVEIISPESRGRDRGDKYYEYEQGGVREYWLLDPLRRQAEFYRRAEDGLFRLVAENEDGVFHSEAMLGLWFRVDWLWQSPRPSLLDVLRQWRLL